MVECLSGSTLTVREIAERLGQHRHVTRRFLEQLVDAGWVTHASEHRYRLTTRSWSVGIRSSTVLESLRGRYHPLLVELASQTDAAAGLVVLEADEAVHIGAVGPGLLLTDYNALGRRTPAHATASGKALLALAPAELLRVLAAERLRRYTPATICDPNRLGAELAAVARDGYAVSRGEYRPERGGFAAAVPGASHNVAICLSGPLDRVLERQSALVRALV